MGGGEASPLHTVVTERSVGWAKRSVPTIQDNGCGYVVGTLRFAHPTALMGGPTPRFPETPLPRPPPRPGFRHASRRRRAAGRTAVPVRWRDRTFSSAKTRRRVRRRTAK